GCRKFLFFRSDRCREREITTAINRSDTDHDRRRRTIHPRKATELEQPGHMDEILIRRSVEQVHDRRSGRVAGGITFRKVHVDRTLLAQDLRSELFDLAKYERAISSDRFLGEGQSRKKEREEYESRSDHLSLKRDRT